jgi:hypothetical protein
MTAGRRLPELFQQPYSKVRDEIDRDRQGERGPGAPEGNRNASKQPCTDVQGCSDPAPTGTSRQRFLRKLRQEAEQEGPRPLRSRGIGD